MNWRSKGHGKGAEGAEFTGFLDRGVHFEGTLEASGIFRVDAHVKGNLLSTHSLVLGENARVEGQIEGNHSRTLTGDLLERISLRNGQLDGHTRIRPARHRH